LTLVEAFIDIIKHDNRAINSNRETKARLVRWGMAENLAREIGTCIRSQETQQNNHNGIY
jgi:hypothetical protein